MPFRASAYVLAASAVAAWPRAARAAQLEPPRPAPTVAPADGIEGRFGEPITTIGGLPDPIELAFGDQGTLWILLARSGGVERVQGIELDAEGHLVPGRCVRSTEARAPVEWPRPDALQASDGTGYEIDGPRHEIIMSRPEDPATSASPERAVHIGGYGPHPGFFASPCGLAFHGGRLYVADCENHRIQVFDGEGRYLYDWGIHALRPREGAGKLHYPTRVAIAPDGSFAAVLEPLEDRVQIFGPARGPVLKYKTDPTIGSVGVAAHFGPVIDCDGPFMALIETERQTVVVYDMRGEQPVETGRCGGYGARTGQFQGLADVVLDAAGGRMWTVDAARDCLAEWRIDFDPAAEPGFDPARIKLVRSRGEIGLSPGIGASGLIGGGTSVDLERSAEGLLFLLDTASSGVLAVSPDLVSVRRIDAYSVLECPTALIARSDRSLEVIDAARHTFVRLSFGGDFSSLTERHLAAVDPCAVASTDDGVVFVVDRATHQVLVFEDTFSRGLECQLLDSWGGPGVGAGQFWKPSGIALDERGRVLVLDHGNHRVQVFEPDGTFVTAFGSRLYVLPALGKDR